MHKLNLLPKEILASQNKKKFGLFCVLTGSLFLLLLTLIVAIVNNSIKSFENEIYIARKDISEMRYKLSNNLDKKTLRDFEKRLNFYNASSKDITDYYTILDEIINLLPKEISIYSISLNKSNRIKINGSTPSHKHLALFIDELKTIDDIQEVTLGFTRLMDAKDEDIVKIDYDFEIIILLAEGGWQ